MIDLPSRYRSPLFPDMFGQSHRVVRGGGASLSLLAVALGLAAAPAQARSEGEAGRTALESVVVTATRSPAEALNVPASVTVVGEDELEVRAPVRLGDALADVPGLYVRGAAMGTGFPGTGQGVLSLRGIPRTPRTLVMIDGQPVNNALTGGINVAGIPLESIERVEVVRGPYSALYGGAAMGGVVNFLTGSPDRPLTELRAGAGSLGQRGAAIVHRKRYDGGLGIVLSAGYRESDGDPDSSYVVKPLARAGATTGTPVTGVRPTFDPDGTPRYWVGTQGARPWSQSSAQLSLHYSPSASTKLVAGLGWADYSVGYSRPDSFLRDAAGVPVHAGSVLFDDAGTTRRLTLSQTDWFTATPAGERDRRVFVRAEHRLDGGGELRASYGEAFRPPSLFDLYGLTVVGIGASTLVYEPSPLLEPERAKALELGADMAFGKAARASLTLYRQRLEDLVYRRTLPTSTATVTRTQAQNVGAADIDGIEASVRWPTALAGLKAFGSLTHHLRYEISRNDSDPAMVGKKLTDVPQTTWSVGLEYERGPWSGFVVARHVGHVFPSGDDMNEDVREGVFGAYDRYTVVAARVAWRFDRHWGLSLSVDNLTDRVYFVSNRQPGRTVYGELSYRF